MSEKRNGCAGHARAFEQSCYYCQRADNHRLREELAAMTQKRQLATADIRRQLDDLLDCQPYRQDLYDNIVQSFEAMTQKCEELEKLRGLAQMTSSQRGAALAFADDQLLEARKCIAELQQKCDLWRVAAEKEEQLRLSSQQKCEELENENARLSRFFEFPEDGDDLKAENAKLRGRIYNLEMMSMAGHDLLVASSELRESPGAYSVLKTDRDRLKQKCEAAEAERDGLRMDVINLDAALEASDEKLKALAPHGTCACSYDKPGDICGHHSPQIQALEARVTNLTEALERIASFYGRNGELTTLSTIAKAALESKTEEAK